MRHIRGIALAWPFRRGFPLARSLPADFPVVTASLEHLDYVALDAALNANTLPLLTSRMVPHPAATLHQLTFMTSDSCPLVVQCERPGNPVHAEKLEKFRRKRYRTPASRESPCNCLFSTLGFDIPPEEEAGQPRGAQSEASDCQGLMMAMLEVGNRLKSGTTLREGGSSPRQSVNLLLPGRIS